MDIDVTKMGTKMPAIDEVKKELLNSLNELLIRGFKTSYQWYVLCSTGFIFIFVRFLPISFFIIRASDLLLSLENGNNPKPIAKKIEGYKKPKFTRAEVLKRSSVIKSMDIYSIDQVTIPFNEMEYYIHARSCYNLQEYERYCILKTNSSILVLKHDFFAERHTGYVIVAQKFQFFLDIILNI